MSTRHAPKSSTYNIGLRVAFHYSSQLQTWSKTWSQTCVSVSQAGRKPAANLLKTRWFLQSRVWRDLSRSSTYRSQYMEDADDIVQSLPTCLYCARCLQFRCRDDVSGQEETETLHIVLFFMIAIFKTVTGITIATCQRHRPFVVNKCIVCMYKHSYGAYTYSTLLPELEVSDISRYSQDGRRYIHSMWYIRGIIKI